jgi:phosphoglycolate phosphatase-like HAD superfamily hydrolase
MSLQAILFDRDGTLFDTRARDVLGYLYRRYVLSREKFNLRLIPRVKQVIDYLSSLNLEMAMISSGTGTKATTNILQALGLNRFKSVLTLDDYGSPTLVVALKQFLSPNFKTKFKAWQISESLKRLNILPYKALVVGDSVFDILAGKIIGTRTAFITKGSVKSQSLLEKIRPDITIQSILRLPEAIEAFVRRQ